MLYGVWGVHGALLLLLLRRHGGVSLPSAKGGAQTEEQCECIGESARRVLGTRMRFYVCVLLSPDECPLRAPQTWDVG